jgi:hypothetical protein
MESDKKEVIRIAMAMKGLHPEDEIMVAYDNMLKGLKQKFNIKD